MLSAVEFSKIKSRIARLTRTDGRIRTLTNAALETAALPIELRPLDDLGLTKNRPVRIPGWAAVD
jgi:hypothetical protein